jgi:hypothetical protein
MLTVACPSGSLRGPPTPAAHKLAELVLRLLEGLEQCAPCLRCRLHCSATYTTRPEETAETISPFLMAGQLAELALSQVEGLRQGPPWMRASDPWAGRQASERKNKVDFQCPFFTGRSSTGCGASHLDIFNQLTKNPLVLCRSV